MPAPKVTVLMPAYNCERFVGEAIAAVLRQTYRDFELIVINDGSTDGTAAVIRGIRDERLLFLENEGNRGIIHTLNKGLDQARGEYILRTDADDVALEDMMAVLVTFLDTHPDHIVCGGNMRLIDGERIFTYPSGDEDLKIHTLNACPFSHSTVIFRREALEKGAFRYDEAFKDGEDHALWSQLLPYGKFHNLERVTLLYRESNTQITAKPSYAGNYVSAREKIFSMQAARYFDLRESEIAAYVTLILQRKVRSFAELEAVGAVILKALQANTSKGFFSPGKLRKALFVKWHWTCFQAYPLGKKVFGIYLKYLAASGNLHRVRSVGAHLIKTLQA